MKSTIPKIMNLGIIEETNRATCIINLRVKRRFFIMKCNTITQLVIVRGDTAEEFQDKFNSTMAALAD